MSIFKKAEKSKSKLRLAIFAPSGGGKTYTALRIAAGLGGKIALIDTERGSASKYSDRFDFDVAELTTPKISNYISFMAQATDYDVLIIDSLSHGWAELIENINKLTETKYRGNSWRAWSEGTPIQKKLIDSLLSFPGHIIATMRVKTEWITETGNNGKMRPVRVGLSPEQGKGIEYEFDMLMEMTPDHFATVIKDRTGQFQDKIIEKPDENLGKDLAKWLNNGIKEKTTEKPSKKATKKSNKVEKTPAEVQEIIEAIKEQAVSDDDARSFKEKLQETVESIEIIDEDLDYVPQSIEQIRDILTNPDNQDFVPVTSPRIYNDVKKLLLHEVLTKKELVVQWNDCQGNQEIIKGWSAGELLRLERSGVTI